MYGYLPECLISDLTFSPCLPPYERPLDEPELSAEALSALAAHVGADNAEAAYFGALRWGAGEAWRDFDALLRRSSSYCQKNATLALFVTANTGSFAPAPVNSHVFSLEFPAGSNLALTLRYLRFFSAGTGTVSATVAWKAPDGSVAATVWSGTFPVVAGANVVPGIPAKGLQTGSWAPWPATLEFSWTASGALGLPLLGNLAGGACGCEAYVGGAANFGLGFVVESYCSSEGLACRFADLLRPAVLAHAARYFLTAATSSAKVNEWTMTNRPAKERGAERLAEAAKEAVERAVRAALADCDDCCFKNVVNHRLIWKV